MVSTGKHLLTFENKPPRIAEEPMTEKESIELLREFVEECAKRYHLQINKYYKLRADLIAEGDWENGYHCKLEAGGLDDAQQIMTKVLDEFQERIDKRSSSHFPASVESSPRAECVISEFPLRSAFSGLPHGARAAEAG
jgi:hypothetical protein